MGTKAEGHNERPVVWQPQPGPQTALLTCPVPDVFFGGARGGGKTDAMLGDWLQHAHRWGKSARGIIFRRSIPELEDVQRRAIEIYKPLGATYKAMPRTWLFPNGAALKMRWLERDQDASRYQGHAYTYAGFDEAGNWATPDPIDKIRATLRSADGVRCVMRLTGNPGGAGHGWLKERYIKPSQPLTPFFDDEKRTWRVFIPSRLQDNKKLFEADPTYIDRLKSSGPSWLVKAWLEGDWDASALGRIFLREWWRFYTEPPTFHRIVQSWDTGFKIKTQNDPSVCTTWGIADNGYYLLDCWRERVEFPELKRQAVALADKWHPHQILVEDKASGQSLVQELQRETRLPLKPAKPEGDKVARANAVTPLIEAGRVFLPSHAPWLSDYMDELATFPHAAHDDQVDSTTQALAEMALYKREPARRAQIPYLGR